MLYKVVLTFKSVDETLVCVTIQMKASEQYFRVLLFIMLVLKSPNGEWPNTYTFTFTIMLYKLVLNLKSVDKTK